MSDDQTTITSIDRQEWLESKRVGIGASEAAAIFGLSPYTTPLQLYLEKRGELPPSDREFEHLKWGRYLEGPLVQAFADETKRIATKEPPFTIRRHPSQDWMVATLDATQAPQPGAVEAPGPGPGVLELKNAGGYNIREWKEEPPLAFQIQVQHQMAVTGFAYGSIAALVGGNRFVWQDVPRNDEFIAVLMEKEHEFIQRVRNGVPPEPDGDEATRKMLSRAYPRDTGRLIVLDDPVWIEADERQVALQAQIKELEEEREKLLNTIRLAMADATAAALRNGVVYTLKTIERKAYTAASTSFRTLKRKGPRGE